MHRALGLGAVVRCLLLLPLDSDSPLRPDLVDRIEKDLRCLQHHDSIVVMVLVMVAVVVVVVNGVLNDSALWSLCPMSCVVPLSRKFKESADTHHDHIHRGQDKSENGPRLSLESISLGVWHCIAQIFQNAVQRNAKLTGRPIIRPVGSHFPIFLGLGVYGHGVCLHSLHA